MSYYGYRPKKGGGDVCPIIKMFGQKNKLFFGLSFEYIMAVLLFSA
jgi:hypothetical protein